MRSGKINENFALYALNQTKGVGSRENSWQSSSGNLHLSFC
ncbi:biotin--[acetyl-CoA-carboxylase] ligase, partial [Campylobacter coli]